MSCMLIYAVGHVAEQSDNNGQNEAKCFSIVIAYGPAGDVEGSQVLGGVERALYELRQPRVVLGLARSLRNGRFLFQLSSYKIGLN